MIQTRRVPLRRFLIGSLFAIVLPIAITSARGPSAPPVTPDAAREIIFYATFGYRDGVDWIIPLRAKAQVPVQSPTLAKTVRTRIADFFAEDVAGHELRLRFEKDTDATEYRIGTSDGRFPATDVNGIVDGLIRMPDVVAQRLLARSTDGWLTFRDASPGHQGAGRVRLISGPGLSVVSDIDDTIKVSEVPAGTKRLIRNTFRKPFVAVDGMSARYAAMSNATFHYVSGSPWQLYRPLSAFLIGSARFPEGTFHMKTLAGTPGKPLAAAQSLERFVATEGTFDHKVSQITLLMERLRARDFILIGDSGECDPEVYRQIAEGPFGTRVKQIIIRDVVNARALTPQRLNGMTIIDAPFAGATKCTHPPA